MAADIESLIRQALARQNGFDPQVRAGIYQSSRNALAKMIAKSGIIPPDVIESRNAALELTISKIEREFTAEVVAAPQIPNPADAQTPANPQSPPAQPVSPVSIPPAFEPEPVATPAATQIPAPSPAHPGHVEPQIHLDEPHLDTSPTRDPVEIATISPPVLNDPQVQYAEPTPQYARPRRKPIRYVIWITAIAIFAVVGWVAYMVTMEILGTDSPTRPRGQISSSDNGAANGEFVTILDATEPGALVTSGNGTAVILSDASQPAIRIMSLRKPDDRETSADPMMLELAPGILKTIAGKKVTVEIRAKSGDNGPATFSVSCNFGDLGECGRKRFRIGLQPEDVIFSIQISGDYKEGQRASLAINTDVTSAAALSGKGAQIDIVYARIRTGNGN